MRPDAVPKHRHHFKSYVVDKDEKKGTKCKIVECTVPGCTVRFVSEKFWKG